MSKSKAILQILYWVVVFAAQIFTVWFCFVLIFQSSSWPTSFWEKIIDGWPLLLVSFVAISLLAYAGTKIITLAVALFYETRKKK